VSCNDNAVIKIQHTQNIFDLQTPFVEILAGFSRLIAVALHKTGHQHTGKKWAAV